MTQAITNVSEIFEQGNRHMQTKLRYFSKQGQIIVKYIVSKLRKYNGNFYESYSTISENVGVSTKTVQRVVKRAQELEIFVVSSRTESTLNGKMRKTSNVIRLLPYKAVQIIKEIVETVVEVTKKVKEVVTHVSEKVSKVMKSNQVRKPYTKKPIRQRLCLIG